MKLDAKNSPRALQMPKSAARHASILLMIFVLSGAGALHASPLTDGIGKIQQLAAQKDITAGDYSAAVADIVKHDADDASALMAEAVKDKPPYACDVVKACILALMPANGNIDPQLVATIVVDIVRAIEQSNPDVVKQVVSCAVDVDKDAGPFILNGLAGLFSGPHGINRPPGTFGGQVPPGGTPPKTPAPVTPVQNP